MNLMTIPVVDTVVDIQVAQATDNIYIVLDVCVAHIVATQISIIMGGAPQRDVDRYLLSLTIVGPMTLI